MAALRTPQRRGRACRAGLLLGSALLVAGVGVPAPAGADSSVLSNTTAIPVSDKPCPTGCDSGKGNPYPSTIAVSGMAGSITKVTATLVGFTHTFPDDVDVLLVGPTGQNLLLVSDAGGSTDTSTVTTTFDDAAATAISDSGPWITGTVRPADYDAGLAADPFPAPAPAPSAATALSTFNGSVPNGTWSLYVVDDSQGDTGTFAGGWTLSITTNAAAAPTTTTVGSSSNPSTSGSSVTFTATVTSGGGSVGATGTMTFKDGNTVIGGPTPLNGSGQATLTTSALAQGSHVITGEYSGTATLGFSFGSVTQVVDNATVVDGTTFCNGGAITVSDSAVATPYPSRIFITGQTAVANVTATLKGVTHPFPDDIDVLLVGPGGQNLLLVSDGGGGTAVSNLDVTFTDAAAGSVPDTGGWITPSKPVNYGTTDNFPDGPALSGATTLSAFNGTDPNGTWSLYVVDDSVGSSGSMAGGWCLTFAFAQARPPGDFDGDLDTDKAVYRPSTGTWYVLGGNPQQVVFGTAGDIAVPADHDGDGDADKAVYRPSTGAWFVLGGNPFQTTFGAPDDIPVPADYDGDGDADKAVYRPSTGQWFVLGGTPPIQVWGASGDVPVPGDYDGDGDADKVVYRPSTGQWFVLGGATQSTQFGTTGDVPVPADFDGNGTMDMAVYRPSTGQWFVLGGAPAVTTWGAGNDVPVPGDYDGDADADKAVYRPSTGQWFVLGGAPTVEVWGASGDVPLPLAAAIRLAYF